MDVVAASEGLRRAWALKPHLEAVDKALHDERVLALAAGDVDSRPGVVVATDRRVFFVSQRRFRRVIDLVAVEELRTAVLRHGEPELSIDLHGPSGKVELSRMATEDGERLHTAILKAMGVGTRRRAAVA